MIWLSAHPLVLVFFVLGVLATIASLVVMAVALFWGWRDTRRGRSSRRRAAHYAACDRVAAGGELVRLRGRS